MLVVTDTVFCDFKVFLVHFHSYPFAVCVLTSEYCASASHKWVEDCVLFFGYHLDKVFHKSNRLNCWMPVGFTPSIPFALACLRAVKEPCVVIREKTGYFVRAIVDKVGREAT